jgi:hypothetical protein
MDKKQVSKRMQKRLGKGWRAIVDEQKNRA